MNMIAPTRWRMTVAEFLEWDSGDGQRWQLVDGEPQETAPTNRTHGTIHTNLTELIAAHLRRSGRIYNLIIAPGVKPRGPNLRIPELAVVSRGYTVEQQFLSDPVLAIEILSPSNARQTWSNVWSYTTIASLREVLIVETEVMGVEIVRRQPDGEWPDEAVPFETGSFRLDSIDREMSLADFYADTMFDPS